MVITIPAWLIITLKFSAMMILMTLAAIGAWLIFFLLQYERRH